MIKVNHLNVNIDKKNIIDDVSFKVQEGKIHLLVGMNGTGKTTILNAMTNIYPTKPNSILFDGIDSNKIESKKLFGFMPSASFLKIRITVKKFLTILTNFSITNKEIAKAKIDKLLKEFNADKFKDKKMTNLSSGQFKKILLINALIGEPKYLILDEPLANLEITIRNEILNKLEELKKQGVGILIVTHNLADFRNLADTITVIDQGRIINSVVNKDKNIDIRTMFKEKGKGEKIA